MTSMTGVPAVLPLLPNGSSNSKNTSCRVWYGVTPAASAPVVGLASRTIFGSWLAPPRSAAPVAGL